MTWYGPPVLSTDNRDGNRRHNGVPVGSRIPRSTVPAGSRKSRAAGTGKAPVAVGTGKAPVAEGTGKASVAAGTGRIAVAKTRSGSPRRQAGWLWATYSVPVPAVGRVPDGIPSIDL